MIQRQYRLMSVDDNVYVSQLRDMYVKFTVIMRQDDGGFSRERITYCVSSGIAWRNNIVMYIPQYLASLVVIETYIKAVREKEILFFLKVDKNMIPITKPDEIKTLIDDLQCCLYNVNRLNVA